MSKRLGESLEFAELRPYEAGDDLRTVDWNAYRRLRKLLVRRYRAEQSQDVYILLDTSSSMELPRSKFDLARRIAGAAAVLAAGEHDRLTLLPFSDMVTGRYIETRRGRMPVETLRTLSNLTCLGETSLSASLEAAAASLRRPGLLLVLSDFLDPQGLGNALRVLSARGAEPVGVHIYAPEEARPKLLGSVSYEDSETGEEHELEVTNATNRAYRELFEEHRHGVHRRFQELNGAFHSVETGSSLEELLFGLFGPRREALR